MGVVFMHPGTDFFLVLVGVVAALIQAKRIPKIGWKAYVQTRYVRLYITYIPLFLIALTAKWGEVDLNYTLRSFFFVPLADIVPLIGATWMLSMFMLFYFVFSIAFLVQRESILWPLFILWTISIIYYTGFKWKPDMPLHWSQLLFNERNLNFIFGYLVGVVLREYRLTVYWGRRLFWAGLLGVIGGTILFNLRAGLIGRSLIVGIPVAVLILGLATLEQRGVKHFAVRFLTKSWLVWLGSTSYVLYLSHGIFLEIWERLFPITPLLAPVITLGAILIGAVGYHFWEEPLLRYFKKNVWRLPQLPKLQMNDYKS